MSSILTTDQAKAALGAMKTVALVNGSVVPEAVELIEAVADELGVSVNVATLPPCEPEAAARIIPEERRAHVLHAQIVAAAIDGEFTRAELEVVRRFEAAYGLRDPWVKNMGRIVDGKKISLFMDLGRRMPSTRTVFEADGLMTVWKIAQFMLRLPPGDPKRAWRFKRLGLLPEGTFGRLYWEFTTSRGIALAGEIGGIPYAQWQHDALHLLTGYDTTQTGEMLICAFYAGWQLAGRHFSRRTRKLEAIFPDDPFTLFFMPLCCYHLGMKLGGQGPSRGLFAPRRVLDAMRRGAAASADLNHGDELWDLLELPIDEVRRRMNIDPVYMGPAQQVSTSTA